MDMSMDMDMGDMDMGSSLMFRTYNEALSRIFWYIFAGFVGMLLLLRTINAFGMWSRIKLSRSRSVEFPTRPHNIASQVYATTTAILREICYPQLYFKDMFSWLCPPPLGRCILLLIYWAIVTFMMTYKAIVRDPDWWERIGFRSAWISLTQVPLVFLLSSKASLIGSLIGSSYDRLNWFHRWVSRTLLFVVTIHGGFFIDEWYRADFVGLELKMLPMVRYGLGAWAVLVWTFLTSLSPLRRFWYELFVMQHIVSAAVLLWLTWRHVPKYSRYYVYFAIGAAISDWIFRGILVIYHNFKLSRIGFQAHLQPYGKDITVIKIPDVPISWKAGQHLHLWIPRLGPLETHPFTIACHHVSNSKQAGRDLVFAIHARKGLTKRINTYAQRLQEEGKAQSVTVLISGPYGILPNWRAYETVILISASTGASFTLPVLEDLLDRGTSSCVQRVSFLVLARQRNHIGFYIPRLLEAVTRAEAAGIDLTVNVCITQGDISDISDEFDIPGVASSSTEKQPVSPDDDMPPIELAETSQNHSYVALQTIHSASSSVSDGNIGCSSPSTERHKGYTPIKISESEVSRPRQIVFSRSRPNIFDYIRFSVEITGGETTIGVCGGKSLVSTVRNCVASLSDERAVHKGTGAQGIHMYAEEFCF